MPLTPSKPSQLKKRINSFKFAFNGINILFSTQINARIHLIISFLAVGIGFFAKLSRNQWCILLLTIAIVIAAEAINTAIEFLADAVTDQYHPLIGKAKDIAAAAVLICSIGAVIIGFILFRRFIFSIINTIF